MMKSNLCLAITLARVFMNKDTTTAYEIAFRILFTELSKITSRSISWRHIHGVGIGGIIVDMCFKQATGNYIQAYLNIFISIDTNRFG